MNLEEASTYHRYIILSVLTYFLTAFFLAEMLQLAIGIVIVLWVCNIFFGYRLAEALGKSGWLWVVFGIPGPFLLWIPYLLLVNAANKAFRAEGMKIGFLGGARRINV